jgi:hypothetical protein
MFPIRLCWAWTVWKAQGQTIRGKLVVNLSDKEKEHGLTYVVFSRATMLENIGIVGGLTKERLCCKVQKHAKMRPRMAEESRLRGLSSETAIRLRQQEQQHQEQQQEQQQQQQQQQQI